MKTQLLRSGVWTCGLLAVALTGWAGPLHRGDVAAEPTFVLHVDFDGLRTTDIGQFLLAQMDRPEAQGRLAAVQTIFNFDPRKQLHGLTVYSTGKTPQDGVVLAYGDFDAERLVSLAKGAKDYQSTTNKGHVIHNWINEQKLVGNGENRRVYAAFQGGKLAILAQKEARVVEALEVLDHKAPSLAGSTLFPQLGAKGNTSFIQAAARKLEIPDFAPNAALLRMAKAVRLDVGEAQGQLKATLVLEAGDEEVSRQMVSVGQGLAALLKLQQGNPGALKLAEGLSLKQDGTGVAATLVLPTAQVIELLKAGAARRAAR